LRQERRHCIFSLKTLYEDSPLSGMVRFIHENPPYCIYPSLPSIVSISARHF
jgi:hypothetical protein